MRYVILCGGAKIDCARINAQLLPSDFILCADEGAIHARTMGIFPQMIIGDMDSIDPETLAWAKDGGVPMSLYPVDKDMTDSELCLFQVPEKDSILLVMPLSGRFDHVLSNVMIAARYAREGRNIEVTDGRTRIYPLLGPGNLKIDVLSLKKILASREWIISLIPVGGTVEHVNATGLYYPVEDLTIFSGQSRGVSNRPVYGATEVAISFATGVLLVIISPEDPSNDS